MVNNVLTLTLFPRGRANRRPLDWPHPSATSRMVRFVLLLAADREPMIAENSEHLLKLFGQIALNRNLLEPWLRRGTRLQLMAAPSPAAVGVGDVPLPSESR
jgi:hypothetical protein